MKPARIALLFAFAFGSIIVPVVAVLFFSSLTYKPPFSIALPDEIQAGYWQAISEETPGIERLDRDLTTQFPESKAAVRIHLEGGRVTLVKYASSGRARQKGEETFQEIPTSSATAFLDRYFTYQRRDDQSYGVSFTDGPWVLVSESSARGRRTAQLSGLPFLQKQDPSPMLMLFEEHLDWVFIALGLYVLLCFMSWPRLASWSAQTRDSLGA